MEKKEFKKPEIKLLITNSELLSGSGESGYASGEDPGGADGGDGNAAKRGFFDDEDTPTSYPTTTTNPWND